MFNQITAPMIITFDYVTDPFTGIVTLKTVMVPLPLVAVVYIQEVVIPDDQATLDPLTIKENDYG
jgi:hypothetical protein